jgi:hypothetical protein
MTVSTNKSRILFFAKYNYTEQVKEDEMGRACDTHGGEEECI